jgi:hypothetical protein
MNPRTTALVVFGILVGSLFLRLAVFRFGLLPVTAEAVLKKAKAIQVDYISKGLPKSLRIDKPAEVAELLSVLRLDESNKWNDMGRFGRGTGARNISFEMPDGQRQSFEFTKRASIGPFGVAPAFYVKLCELVSQHEGRRIDILGSGAQ